MPYYPGQVPNDSNQHEHSNESAVRANFYATSQQHTGQDRSHSHSSSYYQQQHMPQHHEPSISQSQSTQQPISRVEVVIPLSSQTSHQPQASTGQPTNTNVNVLQGISTQNASGQQAHDEPDLRGPPPMADELDYSLLSLCLADEYFEAARSVPHSSTEYYKLVATALGCLESVLINFRLQPLKEAHVCLHYAQVMFDETENNDEIEKVLTKSIELCERNRFIDLKYTMQALLTRTLYRSKPKAAVKHLQSMTEEAEAYHHIAWEYNFRFLRVSLFLGSSPSGHDSYNATSQLEKICAVAQTNGDRAINAFGSTMLALITLQSSSHDAVAVAQRALANARQWQLNPGVADQAQMQILMEFIDLACSLQEGSLSSVEPKMKSMQKILYERIDEPTWHDDGTVYLPLSRQSLHGVALQEGGTIVERNGNQYLPFRWLPKATVEVIGYLLSAAGVSHKNASDGGKAEKYLDEGLKLLRAPASTRLPANPMNNTIQKSSLECCFLLEKTFLLCGTGEWKAALSTAEEVFALSRDMASIMPAEIIYTAQYLKGAIQQAIGDVEKALQIFQSAIFALSPATPDPPSVQKSIRTSSGQKVQQDSAVRRVCLLAAMNSILIVRSPSHPQHHLLQPLLASIQALIPSTSNKAIQASYYFVLSTLADPSTTILKTKQHLGTALSVAQQSGNAQVTALTLILMSDKFFKGVVGDQAMKCAKAASHQARRSGDPLWLSVAQGMEAESLEIMGRTEDAKRILEVAKKATAELPPGILRAR